MLIWLSSFVPEGGCFSGGSVGSSQGFLRCLRVFLAGSGGSGALPTVHFPGFSGDSSRAPHPKSKSWHLAKFLTLSVLEFLETSRNDRDCL